MPYNNRLEPVYNPSVCASSSSRHRPNSITKLVANVVFTTPIRWRANMMHIIRRCDLLGASVRNPRQRGHFTRFHRAVAHQHLPFSPSCWRRGSSRARVRWFDARVCAFSAEIRAKSPSALCFLSPRNRWITPGNPLRAICTNVSGIDHVDQSWRGHREELRNKFARKSL